MRKAMALQGRKKLWQSYQCYKKGIEIDPTNKQMISGMHSVVKDHLANQSTPLVIDTNGIEKVFENAESVEKLKVTLSEQNANIAEYFKEQEF